MDARELAGMWRELEALDERLTALEKHLDGLSPFERAGEGILALLTASQKLAGFLVVCAAVGSFVLQLVHG